MALDFFAGCVGGCAGVIVGHPLDTVKVRLQTQDYKNPIYRGTWHCFTSIAKQEKLSGLYRGVSSPLGGVAVVNAIVFGVYGNAQRALGSDPGLGSHFLAGAAAGCSQAFVCGPLELAKTRLQLSDRYRGAFDCLRTIFRGEGLRGVARGMGLTLAREIPAFGTYFLTYEYFTQGMEEVPTWKMLLAGGLAGSASWIIVYPVDVLKTRIQSDGVDGKCKYRGSLDCLVQSYRSEGPKFLGRGMVSTIIRAFPTNAVTFTVVNWTMRLGELAPAPSSLLKPQREAAFSFKAIRQRSVHLFEEGTLAM